jgi:transglutaminase-like putative cysteine protease
MFIRIGYDITFQTAPAVPMNLVLYTHPSRAGDLLQPDLIHVECARGQQVPVQMFIDSFGNKVGRIVAPGGRLRIWSENTIADSGMPDPIPQTPAEQRQAPPNELPPEVLRYLMSSRYCEVDLLQNTAWSLFGHLRPGWARARAVVNWVHNHITFGYQYARDTKTALEVLNERQGVCRDFQHLCVSLHRCLNLPARYVMGYLGDIGVPPNPTPMDFSAWHEVYLGGRWWAMDGRHHQPRIGRILMAAGRDAVDVALTTQFGSGGLLNFKVVTEEVGAGTAELTPLPTQWAHRNGGQQRGDGWPGYGHTISGNSLQMCG